MSIWECQSCGYLYDPEGVDESSGKVLGIPFELLPGGWLCPDCGASKLEFDELGFGGDDDDDDDEDEDDNEEAGFDNSSDDDDEDEAFEDDEDDEDDEDGGWRSSAFDEDSDPDLNDDDDEDEDASEEEGESGSDDSAEFDADDDEADDDDDALDALFDDNTESAEELNEGNFEEEEDDEESAAAAAEYERAFEHDDGESGALEEYEEELDEEDLPFVCGTCGWVFEPEEGYIDSGVPSGTAFVDLPAEWACPACGATRAHFRPRGERQPPNTGSDLGRRPGREGVLGGTGWRAGASSRLSGLGLDTLVFRPAPIFSGLVADPASVEVSIGSRAEQPLRLSVPVVIAPVPCGLLTHKVKAVVARSTSKQGIACTSGAHVGPETHISGGRMILELRAGAPMPTSEQIGAAEAVLVFPGRAFGEILIEGALAESGGARFQASTLVELRESVTRIRKDLRGPLGIRLPAAYREAELEQVMGVQPDFLFLEGAATEATSLPQHLRAHSDYPQWLAVRRVRTYLDSHGGADVSLLVGGDTPSSADVVKLLALGADAVVLSTAALVVLGIKSSGSRPQPGAGENVQFEIDDGVDRLSEFLQNMAQEISDICRFLGAETTTVLNPTHLCTISKEMGRLLGL